VTGLRWNVLRLTEVSSFFHHLHKPSAGPLVYWYQHILFDSRFSAGLRSSASHFSPLQLWLPTVLLIMPVRFLPTDLFPVTFFLLLTTSKRLALRNRCTRVADKKKAQKLNSADKISQNNKTQKLKKAPRYSPLWHSVRKRGGSFLQLPSQKLTYEGMEGWVGLVGKKWKQRIRQESVKRGSTQERWPQKKDKEEREGRRGEAPTRKRKIKLKLEGHAPHPPPHTQQAEHA